MTLILIRLLTVVANGASVSCTTLSTTSCDTNLPQVSANSSVIHQALSIFFGIAAVISVLMIIIGAMMFITSGGSPEQVAKARQTIIYAAIGLVVSLSALAVVEFVLGHL